MILCNKYKSIVTYWSKTLKHRLKKKAYVKLISKLVKTEYYSAKLSITFEALMCKLKAITD